VPVSKCLSWKELIDTRNDNPDFKAVVKLFTEGLYAELLETPVKVTIVYPGGVTTNIAQNSWAAVPGWTGGIEKGSSRVVIGNDARSPDGLFLARATPRH
jgi:NAD(P)-dependent dehydrogenase (short-subunit alcohol dehydrogenase family)